MGISSEMPFVIGSADGQLANLGSGAISPGRSGDIGWYKWGNSTND